MNKKRLLSLLTLAIMVVEGNYKIDTINFAQKSVEKSSKEIEIIGVRTNGKKS